MAKSPSSFSYTIVAEKNAALPLLEIQIISTAGKIISGKALLDSGASVSVLPRSLGEALGLNWDKEFRSTTLGGALTPLQAKMIVLETTVPGFSTIPIGYAWAETDAPRLILGQVNFFQVFKVCFNRKQLIFDLRKL